ncbi:hypothetical protein GCM10007989_08870 [Devosia pacifica]|uniref:Uncharacterized protein n=1 Tax=Devosia pacifica TaxID=1335967 RepID=A0A918RYL8_9HYPH|nr:hypothetical protein [Devosia pacifica]GHA16081.1 hypothetical protein GCM10007989_08870 [Devosia pacifica]
MGEVTRHIRLRGIHATLGIIVGSFVLVHLLNQAVAAFGEQPYDQILQALRLVYRQPIVELLLVTAVLVQVALGLLMVRRAASRANDRVHWLQLLAAGYMALFISAHLIAILLARTVFGVDTGLSFATLGYQTLPGALAMSLIHFLAIMAFFVHVACALYWRGYDYDRERAEKRFSAIIAFGCIMALAAAFGLWRTAEIATLA